MNVDMRQMGSGQTVTALPLPRLLIATRVFGASGQPWIRRQVSGFKNFRMELLCWERLNQASQPATEVPEHVFGDRAAPYDDAGRWLHRLRAIAQGSFYAAVGRERSRLRALVRRTAPDAILCHFGDVAMRLLPVARAAGVPLIAHLHGDFLFNRNRWYRWSLRLTLRQFAAIVVVTSAERDWLIAHGAAPEKIHLIPCGAPTDLFRPLAPSDTGATDIRFVMASRLSPDKGCELSLRAFAMIAGQERGTRLTVFGDGEDRKSLEDWVTRNGLGSRIDFRGYVDERRLAQELPLHDVFIQHSLIKEGSPVAIAEAMACGLPVIATAVGGIVDQVAPSVNGYLIAENDVAGMAKAMQTLAADPILRVRMGEAGRLRCRAMFDTERQTKRLADLVGGVIHRAHGPRSYDWDGQASPSDIKTV